VSAFNCHITGFIVFLVNVKKNTVKSNKVYNEILTFIIYSWANRSVYSTNQTRYNSIFLSLTLKNLATTVSDTCSQHCLLQFSLTCNILFIVTCFMRFMWSHFTNCPSYGQTSRLHDRYETKHAWYPEIKNLHLSRWGTESVCRVKKVMLHPVSCHSCIRRWKNSMVSQSLQKHGSDIVYLQKTKPCIRKHLITKADRSLVDCLAKASRKNCVLLQCSS
jgi:hypothetical protein